MTTLTSPALTTAWHVATWIDIAPRVPFTARDLHRDLDPHCGRTDVDRILTTLITRQLVRRIADGTWVADRPLLTRGDDRP